MKRFLKYCSIAIAAAVLLAVLAAGFTQTSLFRSWLRDKIVLAAGDIVGGTLSIGAVEGNMFSHIELSQIALTEGTDTAAAISRLTLGYTLSGIFSRHFHVRTLALEGLRCQLKQMADSSWRLVAIRERPSPAADEGAGAPWEVTLDDVTVSGGSAVVAPLDTASKIPRRIDELTLSASAVIGSEQQSIGLKSLKFRTAGPAIDVTGCSCSINRTSAGISLSDVVLRTGSNSFEGRAFLSGTPDSPSTASVRTSPLDLSEFWPFMPGLPGALRPACTIDMGILNDSAHFSAGIVEQTQRIDCDGTIARSGNAWRCSLSSNMERLDLSTWTGTRSLKSSINGNLSCEGSGTTMREATLKARLRLGRSTIGPRRLDRVAADARYVDGNLSGSFDASSPFGVFNGKGDIADVYGKRRFAAEIRLYRLDVAGITMDTSFASSINGSLRVKGEGRSAGEFSGVTDVALGHSRIGAVGCDTLVMRAQFNGAAARIDTFFVRSMFSEFSGRGTFDTSGAFVLDCAGKAADVEGLGRYLGADSISGSGTMEAHVEGTTKNIEASARFDLVDGKLDALEFRRISGSAGVSGPVKSIQAHVALGAARPSFGIVGVDTLAIAGEYADSAVRSTISFASGDTVSGTISSVARFGAHRSIAIPQASFLLHGTEWRTMNDSASIVVGGGAVTVRNLHLAAGEQSMFVDGTLGGKRGDSLLLDVGRVDLGGVSPFLRLKHPVGGTLDFHGALTGSFRRPCLSSVVRLSDLRFGTTPLGGATAWFATTDSSLSWKLDGRTAKGKIVASEGLLPLREDSASASVRIDSARSWNISLKADSLSLATWSAILPRGDSLDGFLSANFRITGARSAPAAHGDLTIADGAISIPRIGIAYRPVTVGVTFEDTLLRLERAHIAAGKGGVDVTGALRFPRNLEESGNFAGDLHVAATKFEAARSDVVSIVLDGPLDLTIDRKGLGFSGKIEVPQSRWYLPAFLRQFQNSTSTTVPMLVRATNRADTVAAVKDEPPDSLRIDAGLPVNGVLDVHIPRGTLVESPKILAELSGDLAVRVTDSRPAVSGTVEIMRGWVQMFGVRLNFKEGKITLKEGGELVPDVTIKMEYAFRDQNRERKSLIVDIRGSVKDPEIIYTLDGKELKQEDALSYMLFGRSTSDINSNQLSDLNNSASQMIEQMTSSLISSKLSSTVGKSLGMDVIELRGTDNWSKASLTGGKYFTDQLFVSFEKGFGTYDADETIPEILTVEYELYKFLFFQLISGTDDRSGVNVIVKLDTGTGK